VLVRHVRLQRQGHPPSAETVLDPQLSVSALIAFASSLLGKPLKGGLAVVGGVNLGGSIEQVHNPIDVVELALEKGATSVMMPVASRRALMDLSDDVATKVKVVFYLDAADALRKAVHEG
jgi:ATP-dependent Lon protease